MKIIKCVRKRRSKKYKLFFVYNKEFLEEIKSIDLPERKYIQQEKCWELSAVVLYELIKAHRGDEEIFFDFTNIENKIEFKNTVKIGYDLIKREKENLDFALRKQETIKNLKDFLVDNYAIVDYRKYLKDGVVPFPHQIIGAKVANELNRIIISADMGCGKTLMSLLACEMKKHKKTIVICPNNLKLNWRDEILKYTHSNFHIIKAKKRINLFTIQEAKYVIVNYEYFRSSKFDLKKYIIDLGLNLNEIDCVIMDEAHRIKNPKSNTTKNILKTFSKNTDDFYLLSGTIMPSRLEELFIPLTIISPIEFKTKVKFYQDYCNLVYDGTGYVEKDENLDLDKVTEKLNGLMYRVRREDVLKDLPELTVTKINVEMSDNEEKEYHKILKNEIANNLEDTYTNKLKTLINLRKYTTKIKNNSYLIDFITDLNSRNEKVVIFDVFKASLQDLSSKIPNSVYYGGDVDIYERQNIVNKFQEDNGELMNLFITQQSGKEGITLTKARYMILLNQSYVPGEQSQTYARIHRIGAVNTCYVYVFCVENTIDDDVYEINNDKQKIISKVIDNVEFVDQSETSVISELYNNLNKQLVNG